MIPREALEDLLEKWTRGELRCEEVVRRYYEQGMDAPYTLGNRDGISSCSAELETLLLQHDEASE